MKSKNPYRIHSQSTHSSDSELQGFDPAKRSSYKLGGSVECGISEPVKVPQHMAHRLKHGGNPSKHAAGGTAKIRKDQYY